MEVNKLVTILKVAQDVYSSEGVTQIFSENPAVSGQIFKIVAIDAPMIVLQQALPDVQDRRQQKPTNILEAFIGQQTQPQSGKPFIVPMNRVTFGTTTREYAEAAVGGSLASYYGEKSQHNTQPTHLNPNGVINQDVLDAMVDPYSLEPMGILTDYEGCDSEINTNPQSSHSDDVTPNRSNEDDNGTDSEHTE